MSLNIDLPPHLTSGFADVAASLDALRAEFAEAARSAEAFAEAANARRCDEWWRSDVPSMCAPMLSAGEPAAVSPPHSVTDYAAGADGWLRITRRPAPPPLACGVCGTIGAPHAHPNRAQRRAARGRR